MTDQPYQLLPALTGEEYEALKADIAAHGIRVPVDLDELGQVLDGHHRQQIAAELGIPCPTRVVDGLTEDDKRAHALAVNINRRALTVSQRRELVRCELERDPSRSDRAIGRLCGVDGKTVASMRVRNSAPADRLADRLAEDEIEAAKHRTMRIREGLASIDDVAAMLVQSGHRLEAVRFLTTGMDELLALRPDDAHWKAGIRAIFESRIRAALGSAT